MIRIRAQTVASCRCEVLESRLLLAAVSWTNAAGGAWNDAANWSSNPALPGAADDVSIDLPGTYTVTLANTAASVKSVALGGTSGTQTLAVNVDLALATASSVGANGVFSLAAGFLIGPGDLTVSGGLLWSGGAMRTSSSKTIISSSGTLSMIGAGVKQLGRILQNDGTATWTAGNVFSGGVLNNNGSFSVNTNVTIAWLADLGSGAFNNNASGTLTKTGTGDLQFLVSNGSLSINNSGHADILAGSLSYNGGGSHTQSGQFNVKEGALLRFDASFAHGASSSLVGEGTITFSGSATQTFPTGTFNPTGIVNFVSGDITINNPFTATSATIAATVNLNATTTIQSVSLTGGMLNGSGALTVTGGMTWSGGNMAGGAMTTIAVGASLNITGTGTRSANRMLQVDGSASLEPGGGLLLVVSGLSAGAGATVNVSDNDVIVNYGDARSPTLSAIQALINSGRNGGNWLGAGMVSSAARDNPLHNTTLGAMEASDYKSVYGASALFHGQAIDNTAVLIKYTYYGDTDFSGVVDFDDYSRIDAGFNNNRSGWLNGDLDGNGIVDFDDYSLIDQAFNTQGGSLRPIRRGIAIRPGQFR
ncbi:hypothetical protein BH09PLA1_BH09PLA1_24410 [soil metagenome]